MILVTAGLTIHFVKQELEEDPELLAARRAKEEQNRYQDSQVSDSREDPIVGIDAGQTRSTELISVPEDMNIPGWDSAEKTQQSTIIEEDQVYIAETFVPDCVAQANNNKRATKWGDGNIMPTNEKPGMQILSKSELN